MFVVPMFATAHARVQYSSHETSEDAYPMSTLTKAKVALAVMGLIIFAAGVRFDDSRLRSVAIGFVAVAWILRFVKSKSPSAGQRTE